MAERRICVWSTRFAVTRFVRVCHKRQTMLGSDRITFDSNVMVGRACIRGMRVTVSLVLNLVSNQMTVDKIITDYPYLQPEDIHQALAYDPPSLS
jgi:uncharacterized protein (DUF433 family)